MCAALSSCGDNQDDAGARALLAQVRAEDYRNWERAPGWPERRSSGAPHSEAVDLYVNDVVLEALVTGVALEQWPTGSIVAKDGWDGSELEIVALMEKREDGWFWAEYDADGDPDYSGRPDICTGCHASGADYVRAFTLPGG